MGVLFGWLLISWRVHALIVVWAYFQHQLFFVLSHLTFHAMFVEHEFKDYSLGAQFAFIHHQPGQQNVLSEHWCEYRSTWFFAGPALRLHTFTLLVACYTLSNAQTVAVYFGVWLFFMNVQAILQEYFHVDLKERNKRFMSGTLLGLRLLESCGLVNFEGHKKHHHHDNEISARPEIETFTDMWCPGLNQLAVYCWNRKLLKLHQPGQRRMTTACHAGWLCFAVLMVLSMLCLTV